MLTAAQEESWRRDGFLLARGLVPPATCEAICDALWRALDTAHGLKRDAPGTWRQAMPRGLARHFKAQDAAALACTLLPELIDDLLGVGTWDAPRSWAQPLPVLPTPDEWDLPSRMWHLDYPVRGSALPLFAVKMLCLLAAVGPRGGGTMLLAGSHTLLTRWARAGNGGNSAHVRRELCREHAWLDELMRPTAPGVDRVQRFMVEGAVIEDVSLRVVEFTGDAGDVVLFHPWLLHNASPNSLHTPRMMVGQNFTTREGLRIYERPPL